MLFAHGAHTDNETRMAVLEPFIDGCGRYLSGQYESRTQCLYANPDGSVGDDTDLRFDLSVASRRYRSTLALLGTSPASQALVPFIDHISIMSSMLQSVWVL